MAASVVMVPEPVLPRLPPPITAEVAGADESGLPPRRIAASRL